MRLWVLAPHMDDEVLSFGGLIRKKVRAEWDVYVTYPFNRRYVPPDAKKTARQMVHMEAARETLGYQSYSWLDLPEGEPYEVGYYRLLEELERQFEELNPDVVAIPGRHDRNQDHRHLWDIAQILLRPGNRPVKKFTVLESVAPDTLSLEGVNYGVALTDSAVSNIKEALLCYEDEIRSDPHPRSLLNLEARYRHFGAQFGHKYVEPYRLVSGVD